jgi:hypothetical protein
MYRFIPRLSRSENLLLTLYSPLHENKMDLYSHMNVIPYSISEIMSYRKILKRLPELYRLSFLEKIL